VALLDELERLLRGLAPVFSEVLTRRLQGDSVADVAEGLRVSRQTVYRMLRVLQQRLETNTSSPES
jgi:hypothetical protein